MTAKEPKCSQKEPLVILSDPLAGPVMTSTHALSSTDVSLTWAVPLSPVEPEAPEYFEIQVESHGHSRFESVECDDCEPEDLAGRTSLEQKAIIDDLQHYTTYRLRVKAVYEDRPPTYSHPVTVQTSESGKYGMLHVPCTIYK